MHYVFIAAGLVVLALVAYALYLGLRLHRQGRERAASPQVVQAFDPAADRYRLSEGKAIGMLACALLDDKMTYTEGCLRICALAPRLPEAEQFRIEYGVLFRVAEATAHIPILTEWKALEREQQNRFNRERQAIEEKYREAILEAAQRLRKAYA